MFRDDLVLKLLFYLFTTQDRSNQDAQGLKERKMSP